MRNQTILYENPTYTQDSIFIKCNVLYPIVRRPFQLIFVQKLYN